MRLLLAAISLLSIVASSGEAAVIGTVGAGETKTFTVEHAYQEGEEINDFVATSDGIAKAVFTIGVDAAGTTITSIIHNLSTDEKGFGFASAITSWGFNTTPEQEATQWQIFAMVKKQDGTLEEVMIGEKGDDDSLWVLTIDGSNGNASIDVSQLALADEKKYKLYNPIYLDDGKTGSYFTSARLVATFDEPLVANYQYPGNTNVYSDGTSPVVRFQQVNGPDSLKLIPTDEPPEDILPPVPEPTSLTAWLLGSAGFGLILRGRMKKAAA